MNTKTGAKAHLRSAQMLHRGCQDFISPPAAAAATRPPPLRWAAASGSGSCRGGEAVSISQLNCMAAARDQLGGVACNPRHRSGGGSATKESQTGGWRATRQTAWGSVQKAHTRSNQSREGLPQHSSAGIDFLSLQTRVQQMGRRLGGVGSAAARAVRAAAQAIFSPQSVSCSRLRLSPKLFCRPLQPGPTCSPCPLAAHAPHPPHLLCVWLRP